MIIANKNQGCAIDWNQCDQATRTGMAQSPFHSKSDAASSSKMLNAEKGIALFGRIVWMFVLSSFLGLLIEDVYCLLFNGVYDNRAGLLVGPFSPLYGVAGVLLLLCAKRTSKIPAVALFFLMAVSGGALEYLTSLLLEQLFSLKAWDYSGMWLSLDGRTSGYFMLLWGALGTVGLKVLMPSFNRFVMPVVSIIPKAATVTTALFMALNIVFTLAAFGCWQNDFQESVVLAPVQQSYEKYIGDDFMASRFQTLGSA